MNTRLLLCNCLLLTATVIYAQDTIRHNPGNVLKLESDNSRFRYNGTPIKEKEAYALLRMTNDPRIINDIAIAKKQKKYIAAGFASIPLVFVSALLISNATQTHGPGLSERARVRSKQIGAGCIVVFCCCSFQAIAANSKRNNMNAEAAKIYNEKY